MKPTPDLLPSHLFEEWHNCHVVSFELEQNVKLVFDMEKTLVHLKVQFLLI